MIHPSPYLDDGTWLVIGFDIARFKVPDNHKKCEQFFEFTRGLGTPPLLNGTSARTYVRRAQKHSAYGVSYFMKTKYRFYTILHTTHFWRDNKHLNCVLLLCSSTSHRVYVPDTLTNRCLLLLFVWYCIHIYMECINEKFKT